MEQNFAIYLILALGLVVFASQPASSEAQAPDELRNESDELTDTDANTEAGNRPSRRYRFGSRLRDMMSVYIP